MRMSRQWRKRRDRDESNERVEKEIKLIRAKRDGDKKLWRQKKR